MRAAYDARLGFWRYLLCGVTARGVKVGDDADRLCRPRLRGPPITAQSAGSGRHAGQRRINRGRGGDRQPVLPRRQRLADEAVGGDWRADVEPRHFVEGQDLQRDICRSQKHCKLILQS
jgi:hypothetical protein